MFLPEENIIRVYVDYHKSILFYSKFYAFSLQAEGGSKLFCPEVELYTSFQLLASHCSLWAATLDPDAPVLGDLANKMSEHVRIVGVYISRLLQVNVQKCLTFTSQDCFGFFLLTTPLPSH